MKQRILFFVPYPTEGASARLRVEQFLPALQQAGIEYILRPFFTPAFYRILYKKGNIVKKIIFFIYCTCRRIFDLVQVPFCDTIFIHREMFPLGPPFLEAILFLFGKKIIFDFDDAIYLPPEGSHWMVALLKCPWKTNFIIKHSTAVIAGNNVLKEYAILLNNRVVIIPTSIDTSAYKRMVPKTAGEEIVIGWVGSHTTQVFLKDMEDIFLRLLARYGNLKIHIIGAEPGLISHNRIIIKEWALDREKEDILEFDIGIMPLPDTAWTRGKCAFKAILYMSFEVPVVVSAVGVNKDMIKDGVNGFLVSTKAEWEEKLVSLMSDTVLRRSIGMAGRATVAQKFSLEGNTPLFFGVLTMVNPRILPTIYGCNR